MGNQEFRPCNLEGVSYKFSWIFTIYFTWICNESMSRDCNCNAHGGLFNRSLVLKMLGDNQNEFVVKVKMECFQNSWGNPLMWISSLEMFVKLQPRKVKCMLFLCSCDTGGLAISWYKNFRFMATFLHFGHVHFSTWSCFPSFRGWSHFCLENMDNLTAGGLLFVEEEGRPEETWPRLGRFVLLEKICLKIRRRTMFSCCPHVFFLGLIEGLIFFWGGRADEWVRFECQLVKGLAAFKFEWWKGEVACWLLSYLFQWVLICVDCHCCRVFSVVEMKYSNLEHGGCQIPVYRESCGASS